VARQFKAANQAGAARVIVVGPEEVEKSECVVRSMDTGEEARLGLAELLTGSV
jgi:histidyl-tRNA synthetase